MVTLFARGCASQGTAPPCSIRGAGDNKPDAFSNCACTPKEGGHAEAVRSADSLEPGRDRIPSKMRFLHDRLVSLFSPLPRSATEEQSRRQFYGGVLLVHLNTVYDLVEGLPVAFVWKVRGKAHKKGKAAPSLFSWPGIWPGSLDKEEVDDDEAAETPSSKLLLTKVIVALSSDLARLEVHHAHEVQMIPLTHITDVWEGLDGTMGALDDWCVVVELADNQQYPLRFFERTQVKPFMSVVVALSHLVQESLPDAASRRIASRSAAPSSARLPEPAPKQHGPQEPTTRQHGPQEPSVVNAVQELTLARSVPDAKSREEWC